MLGLFELFISDLFFASNFQSFVALLTGILFLFGALSLGLLVMPRQIARGSVRALAGVPLFFIIGGALAGLLYYFGVGVDVSGNLLIFFAAILIVWTLIAGQFADIIKWRELVIITALLLVSYILMFFGWGETSDGTIRAISGSWGDGVLHTLNAMAFTIREGGDFMMPAFSGELFHEPIGYDFVAGILLSMGFTIGGAFTLPATALLASLMAVSASFTSYMLRKRFALVPIPAAANAMAGRHELSVRVAAVVSMLLVVLGSGLQWLVMPTIGGLWTWKKFFGVHDPVWDKNEEMGIAWANHLNTLVSQKHLLLAAAFLLVLGFVLYWLITQTGPVRKRLILVILVLSSGLLPFFHAHAFIAAALLWLAFWVLRPNRKSFILGIVVAVIALPVFLSFGAAVSRAGFAAIHPGYLVNQGLGQWILSWIINLGLFLPVLIFAIADEKWGKSRWLIAGPAIGLFALGNIIQFQPYLWDNYKLFLFAWFLVMPLFVAHLFAGIKISKNQLQKISRGIVVVGIFMTLILTSVSETATYFNFRNNYPLFTPRDREQAEKLEELLPADAVVLAVTDRNHRDPVYLTGRNLVLGYGGWIWTRGMDLPGRVAQIKKILRSEDALMLCQNLAELAITHVVIDQSTTAGYWQPVSSEFVVDTFNLSLTGDDVAVWEAAEICRK